MESLYSVKVESVLQIYFRLLHGETLRKVDLEREFGVSGRTIQRYVNNLRGFLAENRIEQDIIRDKAAGTYRLQDFSRENLSNSEILAVCKILLESRSMRRDEMIPILDKLIACCVPKEEQKLVSHLVANEKLHYIEPHHGQKLLNRLWEIGQAIQRQRVMKICYKRLKSPSPVERVVEPVGLMFSEYYFYLAAFLRGVDRQTRFENPDDVCPTIYRVDRIRSFTVLEEHFKVPYRNRFEEGEFRKRVQFMCGGRLEQIRFLYTGPSLEAVLDRLPTAEVVGQDGNGWVVRAEVFGKGYEMWVRGQGSYISMLS